RAGVSFPTYVSNGFPSAPSVFAFHCSAWPHRRKEIMTDFAGRGFDSLPARLRTLGYDAVYVGADPHFDNQSLWLPRWYSKVVDLVAEGGLATDHNIVSRAMDEVRAHDRGAAGQPLFAFVSTYSTHYPFTLPVDAGEAAVGGELSARYRQTLRYSDREAGRLFDFLAARGRRTVTIVVGDHAFYNDLSRTSGVPENDNVWTPAIISGPADLVGPPRRLAMPASHVDMMPTVLRLVGDDRPTASLGSDLLGSSRSARTAFAIRPGGLRLDRGGYSIVVDSRAPNVVTTRVAFPSLLPPSELPNGDPPAGSLIRWATEWSYLIERNRIWSDALLR
ncbi:MAG TPA: sulfatase-like hydrolase/transferase, partial [Vicinamibacterales bacterium]|nr:sulfatase-like hydrolase/transferase [Vicinamibacterales bacterium]